MQHNRVVFGVEIIEIDLTLKIGRGYQPHGHYLTSVDDHQQSHQSI